MLIKYRWFRVKLPKDILDLHNILVEYPLSENNCFGFSITEDSFGFKKNRFLWKTSVVVTRLDNNGEPIHEQIESVNFMDFSIRIVDSKTYLRLENPGRNIKEFFNSLETIIGLGFSITPIAFYNVKPDTIFDELNVNTLVGLKIVDAVIEKDLLAKMDFVSKQGINLKKIDLLKDLEYRIDSASYELIYEGIKGQVTFSSSGLVKISGKLAPKLIPLIENKLPRLS